MELEPTASIPPLVIPTPPRQSDGMNLAILFGLSSILLLPGLSRFGLWDPYEIRIADAARAYMERPQTLQQLGKSPSVIWLVQKGFGWLGVGEFGGRLPLAVVSIMAVLALYYAVTAVASKRAALITGVALLTAPTFVLGSRQLTSSAPQLLGIALSMGGLMHLFWNRSPLAKILGAVLALIGLGVAGLSSGLLVGVVAPFAAIAVALAFEKRWAPAAITAGITLIVIGIVAPKWFAPATYSTLLTGVPHPLNHNTVVTTHLRAFGFGLFPWIILYPLGVAQIIFGKNSRALVLVAWSVSLYVLGTVQSAGVGDFLLPAAPALLPLVGVYLDDLLDQNGQNDRAPFVAFAVLLGAVLIGRDYMAQPEVYIGAHIQEAIRWPGPLTRTPQVLLGYSIAWGALMALAIGVPLALPNRGEVARARGRFFAVAASIFCAFGMAVGTAHAIVPQVSSQLSSKDLYGKTKALDPNAPLGYYRFTATGTNYYADQRKSTQLGTVDSLFEFLAKPERVLVFAGTDELPAIDQTSRTKKINYFVIDDTNARFLILSNQLKGQEKDANPLKRFISETAPTPQHVVQADFEGKVQLLGYDVPALVHRGEDFKIRLYFKVLQPVGGSYKVFIHFDGPGSRMTGDHVPLAGRFPTQNWVPGYYITDEHLMKPDRAGEPSGPYNILMGFFAGDKRLKVTSGPSDNDNRVKLGPMTVDQGVVAHHRDGQGPADGVFEHEALEVLGSGDRAAAGGEQEVTGPEARPGGRASRHDLGHAQAFGASEAPAQAGGDRGGDTDETEVGATDSAVAQEGGDDAAGGGVDGDGESEADAGDGGVDADDPRAGVGEGAAGVAGIEGGVGLDDVLDEPGGGAAAGGQGPAEGADDTSGDGAGQAERASDGHDELAHHELVGLPQLGGLGRAAVGTEHGEVRQGVGADDGEGPGAAVGEQGGAVAGPADDMSVGEQEAGQHHG